MKKKSNWEQNIPRFSFELNFLKKLYKKGAFETFVINKKIEKN